MNDNYYAVIMAGGGGTRLWPLSRKDHPKQMLDLGQGRSLFQMAVDRLDGFFPPERILVVTVGDQALGLREQCPEIPPENYLLETMPRGTASVVGYAATVLSLRNPEAVMAVLTADHIIGKLLLFQQLLQAAYQVALEDYLVTLGVAPTHAATGYGYIKQGGLLGSYPGLQGYRVEEFTEKPALGDAERMLASGQYAWNSGMFIWRTATILGEISRKMPELSGQLDRIQKAWDKPERDQVIRDVWPGIKPQTIDYGIMENAANVAVVPAAGLAWNDVGSWEALIEILPANQDGNIIQGVDHLTLDTSGSIIYGVDASRTVVAVGVEDLIVIDTGDVLLVCRRDRAQDVRQAVRELEKIGRTDVI